MIPHGVIYEMYPGVCRGGAPVPARVEIGSSGVGTTTGGCPYFFS